MTSFKLGIDTFVHKMRLVNYRHKLKNENFTIISNNCIAGVLYKDLNKKFNSPTINLYFSHNDYIKYCQNLNYYINKELEEQKSNYLYPVGKLGDISVHFMHYDSFKEAKENWDKRCKRINMKNIFFIMVERENCTSRNIEDFLNIPYPKIFLSHIPLNLKNTFYIKGFEDNEYLGNIIEYDIHKVGKRYFEEFDFIKYFNNKRD